jgi:hypothetical protein
MNMKKLRVLLLVLFMTISLPFSLEHTYAYWTDEIFSPNTETTVATISIGSWMDQYEEWQSNVSYAAGDVVTYNGSYYRAVRSHSGVPPRGVWYWWFFWTEITV